MDQILQHPLEIVPPGEAALIERVIALQLELMKGGDPKKRGQHPKQQALLRGHFEVAETVPEALRVGVFAKPRKFEALVRLSTGPMPKDSDPNPHGFAIKLLDVPHTPSGTQDFIMLDQPTFFIKDMADYVTFFEGMLSKQGPDAFWRSHPHEYGLNLTYNVVIASHLERQYWSEVPIAMGSGAARLTVIPDVDNASGRAPVTTADGLREALEDHFVTRRKPAKFLFCAQAYVGEATTPIEDATSVWPTPFVPIASLTLPAQDFTAPEQFAVCERLSYSPWHCMAEHRPLGGIQRCRRRLYEESQRLRHGLTGAEDRQPTKSDYDALGKFL